MTQKSKAIALLNDARDNAITMESMASKVHKKYPSKESLEMLNGFTKEVVSVTKTIDNPTAFAMDILRHEMKDKSEGGLYHGWLCNIKYAVYDSICNEIAETGTCYDKQTLDSCEDGARTFLDRLLQDE
jgi:hypothetical protein